MPVRPLRLASDALRWAPGIRSRREVGLYRPEALSAPIHEADVAAVCVRALQTVDCAVSAVLTGPALLSQTDQIKIISDAIGSTIQVEELTPTEMLATLSRYGSPTDAQAPLLFLDNAATGQSPVSRTVETIFGHSATTFATWTHDNLEAFR